MSDILVSNRPTTMKLRHSLWLAGLLLVPAFSCAYAAEVGLRDSLRDCAAVRDSVARLACFEALVEPPQLEVAPAPGNVVREVAPAARLQVTLPETSVVETAAEQDAFGLEHKADDTEDGEAAERYFKVADARHNDFTGWSLEFDNGQVWRQVGTQRYDIEVGETYSVQRASFNSYQLGNTRDNRKMRVTRVR